MSQALSPNAQAILLLTAPLEIGSNSPKADLLKPSEYTKLAQYLMEIRQEPADLISSGAGELLRECGTLVDRERLESLLGRGFLLSQALERWRARAIWVVSRADAEYPSRLKSRLKQKAPSVLYGVGPVDLLNCGGLAVVGSRKVDEELISFSRAAGSLAAGAGKIVVSGGAKGVDQAAMEGALEDGGRACGVLADKLERTSLKREHRDRIIEDRLTLVSPYDPGARFHVGNAMQRNKLIYALADAALVVNSDLEKGGTWTGAVEQLDRLKLVPVFVRVSGTRSPGLDALREKGAKEWPDPQTSDAFEELLARLESESLQPEDPGLPLLEGPDDPEIEVGSSQVDRVDAAPQVGSTEGTGEPAATPNEDPGRSPTHSDLGDAQADGPVVDGPVRPESETPVDDLFETVCGLIVRLLESPKSAAEVAGALDVSAPQARAWLERLVAEGQFEKRKGPVRYVLREKELFE